MNFTELKGIIASPVATSKWVAILLFANTLVSSFALGNFNLLGAKVPIHLLDIASGIAAVLVLLISNRLLGSGLRKKAVTLFIWFAAALMYLVIPDFLVQLWIPGADLTAFAWSSIWGTIQTIVLLLAFTLVVTEWGRSRQAARRLATRKAQLLSSQAAFEDQRTEIEERIRVTVQEKLSRVLSALAKGLGSSDNANPQDLAALVLSGLNQGVRPLSWEIETTETELPPTRLASPSRISFRTRLTDRLSLTEAFNLPLFLLLAFVFEPSTAFYVFGIPGVTQITVVLIATAALLATLHRAANRIQLPAWFAVISATAFAYLCSLMFVGIRLVLSQTADLDFAAAFPASIAQIAFGVGVFSTLVHQREAANLAAQKVNDQLEVVVARVRQVAWHSRQRFARLVHGPVQSRLLAAYLQLKNADSIENLNLQQLRTEVGEAVGLLRGTESEDHASVTEMVESVTAGWGEGHQFLVDIDSELEPRGALDSAAATSLFDALRESVNNAVKHGSEGTYELQIRRLAAGLISLRVSNPISAMEPNIPTEPGYGTTVLDVVCLNHSLQIQGDKAVFVAQIATQATD